MKKNTKYIIAFAVLLVAVLIWFGGSQSRDENPGFNPDHGNVSENSETSENSDDSLNEAPFGNFTLKNLDGEDVTLSDYRGDRPVVLDFFATWCPNCRRDMPKLSGFYEKYKDQVEVIGVNLKENESTVRKYISDAEISFPIVFDPDGVAANQFGARYTNYHVLINTDGSIAGTVPGDISEEHIESLINSQPNNTEEI